MSTLIKSITGREILNSRGKPTVEAELITSNGLVVTASVPSGTSTGKYEARELFDGGKRYAGFGTRKAAENISSEINQALCGLDVTDQRSIDKQLIEIDGSDQKQRLGGNAILAASMACAKAGALYLGLPVYRYLGGFQATKLPDIASTVISGGAFSPSGLEFEDYLLIIEGLPSFSESVEALCHMRKILERICIDRYGAVAEDGGALAPSMSSTEEAFETILLAAKDAGYEQHVKLGLDVAANELYLADQGIYRMKNHLMDASTLTQYYQKLVKDFPLIYIEDPFTEDHWDDFAKLTELLPEVQIVGDDLFATNSVRLAKGISLHAANTLLLKVNQAGTITEAMDAACLAIDHRIAITASLRSGETNDDFQADLAVAVRARQMKLGSPVRGERNAKYNRLMWIENDLL
jgi:enolase